MGLALKALGTGQRCIKAESRMPRVVSVVSKYLTAKTPTPQSFLALAALTIGANPRIRLLHHGGRRFCAAAASFCPMNRLEPEAMKTYSAKPTEIDKKWVLIYAKGLVVGRVASQIAMILRGKHKPTYTPHMDCGDNVIVINAAKVVLTGKKMTDKIYYRHTGFPGGIKETTPARIIEGKFPGRVIAKAVERMLPEGSLARKQMTNLKIYGGAEHPHGAQQPVALDIGARNSKNKRSA
jgi:large subunit ribosomal protein L13